MAKDLSEIEEEYDDSYQKLTEDFLIGVRKEREHGKLRKKYKQDFQSILKKRNKAYLRYLKKHKKDLLEMPEKKRKKEQKMGIYKAYHINFKETFLTRFKIMLNETGFKLSLFFRHLKYNLIPSWLKFFVFRIRLFFSSVFSDVSLFFRGIKLDFYRVFGRKFNKIKKNILEIFSWIKGIINKMVVEKKSVAEKKNIKEEKETKT